MSHEFKPPTTKEEFERRAKEVQPVAARAVLKSLEARRAALVESIDAEIKFYKEALEFHGEEV